MEGLQRRSAASQSKMSNHLARNKSSIVEPVVTGVVAKAEFYGFGGIGAELARQQLVRQLSPVANGQSRGPTGNLSPQAGLPAKSAKTAPIRELTESNVSREIEKFRTNLKAYEQGSEDLRPDGYDMTMKKRNGIALTEQEEWGERCANTDLNSVYLQVMEKGIRKNGGVVLSYSVDDQPVGLMAMKPIEGSPPSIEHFVTHPGSTGAGGALMERAVNTSVMWGHKGKVRLYPENDHAEKAYKSLGFVKATDGIPGLSLNPATSDKWQQDQGGQWALAKHTGEKYLSNFLKT
ncbi:GNAT family N-acetyltransferase [Paraburkholderia aspalathi]|uniref:hypothetical protein n=1 Tax=Paraburkholderia aspalathi TaxID=1324617 RepID=UPI0038BA9C8C